MDNFEVLKARLDAQEKMSDVEDAEFGGYPPAKMVIQESFASLDNFIRKRMGGERVNLTIRWVIDGINWFFDPWTGELKRDN